MANPKIMEREAAGGTLCLQKRAARREHTIVGDEGARREQPQSFIRDETQADWILLRRNLQ